MPFYHMRHSSQFVIFFWVPSNFLIKVKLRRERAFVAGEVKADIGTRAGELSGKGLWSQNRVPTGGNSHQLAAQQVDMGQEAFSTF